MGALHDGHAALIREAADYRDYNSNVHDMRGAVVVSIFVNPAQFSPDEDFEAYPRDVESDIKIATDAGADYVFIPEVNDVYPCYPTVTAGTEQDAQPGSVAARWEGESRPHHFAGVTTVVKRLFDIVQPNCAFFGEKDYQQVRVIEEMVANLGLPVEIWRVGTVRDLSGLALSSRNQYLNDKDLQAAHSISQALQAVQNAVHSDEEPDVEKLLKIARKRLDDRIQLDYLAIVDDHSLEPLQRLDANADARIIFAGRIGTTRLIDNFSI